MLDRTIGATRCQILRLKCIKFGFPRHRWGVHSAAPDPLAVFKGPTSKRREGNWKGYGKGKGRGRERNGREGKGREGGERSVANSWLRHWEHRLRGI